jgi:hypothetical protein
MIKNHFNLSDVIAPGCSAKGQTQRWWLEASEIASLTMPFMKGYLSNI